MTPRTSADSPYFDSIEGGCEITDEVTIGSDGAMRFKRDYSMRTTRQRFGAQAGEPLDLGKCVVTIVRCAEGDL